jgi:hypothetical protein
MWFGGKALSVELGFSWRAEQSFVLWLLYSHGLNESRRLVSARMVIHKQGIKWWGWLGGG